MVIFLFSYPSHSAVQASLFLHHSLPSDIDSLPFHPINLLTDMRSRQFGIDSTILPENNHTEEPTIRNPYSPNPLHIYIYNLWLKTLLGFTPKPLLPCMISPIHWLFNYFILLFRLHVAFALWLLFLLFLCVLPSLSCQGVILPFRLLYSANLLFSMLYSSSCFIPLTACCPSGCTSSTQFLVFLLLLYASLLHTSYILNIFPKIGFQNCLSNMPPTLTYGSS
jgi:hypothetical protein